MEGSPSPLVAHPEAAQDAVDTRRAAPLQPGHDAPQVGQAPAAALQSTRRGERRTTWRRSAAAQPAGGKTLVRARGLGGPASRLARRPGSGAPRSRPFPGGAGAAARWRPPRAASAGGHLQDGRRLLAQVGRRIVIAHPRQFRGLGGAQGERQRGGHEESSNTIVVQGGRIILAIAFRHSRRHAVLPTHRFLLDFSTSRLTYDSRPGFRARTKALATRPPEAAKRA